MNYRTAPWPDFAGQPINHGDRLTHPDGTEFIAVRLNSFGDEGDAWRAVYENPPSISRLCLQIGDRGRAVLSSAPMSKAVRDVLAERQRQIEVEGWTAEHDDQHKTGELAAAAACYALWASAPSAENTYWNRAREEAAEFLWPWDLDWWKPTTPRRDLVKAAALALAEIERFDRAEADK